MLYSCPSLPCSECVSKPWEHHSSRQVLTLIFILDELRAPRWMRCLRQTRSRRPPRRAGPPAALASGRHGQLNLLQALPLGLYQRLRGPGHAAGTDRREEQVHLGQAKGLHAEGGGERQLREGRSSTGAPGCIAPRLRAAPPLPAPTCTAPRKKRPTMKLQTQCVTIASDTTRPAEGACGGKGRAGAGRGPGGCGASAGWRGVFPPWGVAANSSPAAIKDAAHPASLLEPAQAPAARAPGRRQRQRQQCSPGASGGPEGAVISWQEWSAQLRRRDRRPATAAAAIGMRSRRAARAVGRGAAIGVAARAPTPHSRPTCPRPPACPPEQSVLTRRTAPAAPCRPPWSASPAPCPHKTASAAACKQAGRRG